MAGAPGEVERDARRHRTGGDQGRDHIVLCHRVHVNLLGMCASPKVMVPWDNDDRS